MKTTKSSSTTSSNVPDPAPHLIERELKFLPPRNWLGLCDYELAHKIQMETWTAVRNRKSPGQILGVEHPETITLGLRGRSNADIHDLDRQPSGRAHFIQTDRGGQATLHSPGQLVIYPILSLTERGLGVRKFVEILQASTQSLLKSFGIESWPAEGAGLMTANGKIAFIGLRIERGITRHGLSLNVTNDLGLFQQIRSCGRDNAQLTRMADYDLKPEYLQLEALFHSWTEHFALNLGTAPNRATTLPSTNDCH